MTHAPTDALVRLIYASRANHEPTQAELDGLLLKARRRNGDEGITGVLIYCEQTFLQVIEGPRAAVEAMIARITDDPRHSDLRRLVDEPISERSFPTWSMGFERIAVDDLREVDGYRAVGPTPLLSADLIFDGTIALALLQRFAREG